MKIGQRRADVAVFAAVDNGTYLPHNHQGAEDNEAGRDGQAQGRDVEEDVGHKAIMSTIAPAPRKLPSLFMFIVVRRAMADMVKNTPAVMAAAVPTICAPL